MNELPPSGPPPASERPPDDRLDSWKEIAGYMRRDVTTVQRWEKREGMPVHRHVHDKMGSVYAFRTELDGWARSRNLGVSSETFFPTVSSQEPLFRLLGTPAEHKHRLLYEAAHDIPRIEMIKEVVGWMEKYWGKPTPR